MADLLQKTVWTKLFAPAVLVNKWLVGFGCRVLSIRSACILPAGCTRIISPTFASRASIWLGLRRPDLRERILSKWWEIPLLMARFAIGWPGTLQQILLPRPNFVKRWKITVVMRPIPNCALSCKSARRMPALGIARTSSVSSISLMPMRGGFDVWA